MVPEFKDEVDIKLLQKLKKSASDKDYNAVSATLRQLDKTCNSCHNDYRATTVLLYRSADFKSHKITTQTGKIAYKKYMLELTHTINRIKIAVTDDLPQNAKEQIKELKQGIVNLSKDCDTCHLQKSQSQDYLNQTIINKIGQLQIHLKEGNKKDLNKTLGYIAVNACATCHGTHRIAYDIKQQILNR
jgi:cytochrome c556